jgi:electron transfer flavoprotein beta subunit
VPIRRGDRRGRAVAAASKPTVVSVAEKIIEPCYATLTGIMAAKKRPVQVLSLTAVSVDASASGSAAPAPPHTPPATH